MAEALETLSQSTTAKQVGVWVEHMAGDLLRRRVEQIARIEAAPSTPGLVVAAPSDPVTGTRTLEVDVPEARTLVREVPVPSGDEPAPAGTRLRPLTAVLATALLGVLAGLAFVGTRSSPGSRAPLAASASASTTSTATEVPSVDTPPPSTASAPASAPSVALAPASAAPAPAPSTATPTSPPHARPRATPSAPNCSPPYYEDPSGIRRVKPQCL
jgi:hypothetical protein